MEGVTNYFKNLLDELNERVKNPFLLSFVIMWSYWNWELIILIITHDSGKSPLSLIDVIKKYISTNGTCIMFWNPIWYGIIYFLIYYLVSIASQLVRQSLGVELLHLLLRKFNWHKFIEQDKFDELEIKYNETTEKLKKSKIELNDAWNKLDESKSNLDSLIKTLETNKKNYQQLEISDSLKSQELDNFSKIVKCLLTNLKYSKLDNVIDVEYNRIKDYFLKGEFHIFNYGMKTFNSSSNVSTFGFDGSNIYEIGNGFPIGVVTKAEYSNVTNCLLLHFKFSEKPRLLMDREGKLIQMENLTFELFKVNEEKYIGTMLERNYVELKKIK